MIDYFETAKYPLLDKKNFLIGFIVGTLSFLILPIFFVFGYLSKTIRETLKKSDQLPSWDKFEYWKDYFVHGIFVLFIIIMYILPAFLISVAAFSFIGMPAETVFETDEPWEEPFFMEGSVVSAITVVLLFFGSLLFIVALFLLPMAIVLYSASEDIRYAFKLDEIFPKIKNMIIPYAKAFLVSIFVFFLAFLVLFVPGVGFFIGGILFYPILFTGRLFAEVFRDFNYE